MWHGTTLWDSFGIIVRLFWDHLGSRWDHFQFLLKSPWDPSGDQFGFIGIIWSHFGFI